LHFSNPSIGLLGLGEADGAVAQVIDAVPLAKESISKDGERTDRLGEIHAHEGTDARSLDFQNVVESGDGEVVSTQGNGKVGKRVTLGAVDSVLTVP
jgi:hypothetical protein